MSASFVLALNYEGSIARQLGVSKKKFYTYETLLDHADRRRFGASGWHLLILKGMMSGIHRGSAIYYIQTIAHWIASRQMAFVRDKAAKEADVLCTLGQCLVAQPKLQKAIDLGHMPSLALKAWLLVVGREGLAENLDAGFQLAKKGANLGCCDCKGVLAMCHWKGLKHEVNAAQSLQLASDSTLQESKYGNYVTALFYRWGAGGVKSDNAKAYAYYKLAAEQNLAEAQSELGDIYHSGRGVDQNHYKARDLHLLAAAQGNPRSIIQCSAYGKTFIIRNEFDIHTDEES